MLVVHVRSGSLKFKKYVLKMINVAYLCAYVLHNLNTKLY